MFISFGRTIRTQDPLNILCPMTGSGRRHFPKKANPSRLPDSSNGLPPANWTRLREIGKE